MQPSSELGRMPGSGGSKASALVFPPPHICRTSSLSSAADWTAFHSSKKCAHNAFLCRSFVAFEVSRRGTGAIRLLMSIKRVQSDQCPHYILAIRICRLSSNSEGSSRLQTHYRQRLCSTFVEVFHTFRKIQDCRVTHQKGSF